MCSRKDPANTIHHDHIMQTAGCRTEYIPIDNRQNTYSLASAYNHGVRQAKGDVVIFVHDDVFFLTENWGTIVLNKFIENDSLGLLGLAGTTRLPQKAGSWASGGKQFLTGRVVHEIKHKDGQILSMYSNDPKDTPVVVVDGLFMAIRRTLFGSISFDEHEFDHFHFYDLDICMQINQTHTILVTYDILVKHLSAGNYDKIWKKYASRFKHKYEERLPLTT